VTTAGPPGRIEGDADLAAVGAVRLTDEGRAGFADWLGTGLTMPS
jgi:hypothetical protein